MENTSHEKACQYSLPLTGKYLADHWAKFFNIEKKTLIGKLNEHGIRFLKFGAVVIVDAEWFWIDLARVGGNLME